MKHCNQAEYHHPRKKDTIARTGWKVPFHALCSVVFAFSAGDLRLCSTMFTVDPGGRLGGRGGGASKSWCSRVSTKSLVGFLSLCCFDGRLEWSSGRASGFCRGCSEADLVVGLILEQLGRDEKCSRKVSVEDGT